MIKDTVVIDVEPVQEKGVLDELNYLGREYKITIKEGTKYELVLRSVIDREYNNAYNEHRDFYKRFVLVWNGHVFPIYDAEELKVMASSVGGKDNLELGEIVGMWYRMHGRNVIILFFYEV